MKPSAIYLQKMSRASKNATKAASLKANPLNDIFSKHTEHAVLVEQSEMTANMVDANWAPIDERFSVSPAVAINDEWVEVSAAPPPEIEMNDLVEVGPNAAPTDQGLPFTEQTAIAIQPNVADRDFFLSFPFNWFYFSIPILGALAVLSQKDDEQLPRTPDLVVADSDQDNLINASGTADPNTTITVTWPDSSTSSAVTSSSGIFAVESTRRQGSGQVMASAMDAENRHSQTTTVVYVDVTPSDISLLKLAQASDSGVVGDGVTNDRSPQIQGSSEPNSTLTVITPVGETLTTISDAQGNWSVTAVEVVQNGSQTFKVMAEDAAGNSRSADLVLNIDDQLPIAPVIQSLGAISKTSPTITGQAQALTTLSVTTPTGELLTTVVKGDGSWAVTPLKPFSDGIDQKISAFAVDVAGNTSAVAVALVTIDTQAPTVTISNVSLTDDPLPLISGTGQALTTVKVTLPTQEQVSAVVNASGVWSVKPTKALSHGDEQTIQAWVTDIAGNTGVATGSVSIDTAAPVITINTIALSNDPTPMISGTAEIGNTILVTTPKGEQLATQVNSIGVWSVTPTKDFDHGAKQTILAVAFDAAGNQSETTLYVQIDTVAPILQIDALAKTNDTTPVIMGVSEAGSTVTVTTPVGEKLVAVTGITGQWQVTPTLAFLSGRDQNVIATAQDAAGNTAKASGSVTIDTSVPVLKINTMAITNDATPLISGTGDAGSTVVVTTPVGETMTATVNSAGVWNVTPKQGFNEGQSQSIKAKATNTLGSTSEASSTVTIDVTAPMVKLDAMATTNDTTPLISGTGEAGVSLVVTTPVGEKISTLISTAGVWRVTPQNAFVSGDSQQVNVLATDAAGNSTAIKGLVSIDTKAPVLQINALPITNDATPMISGKGDAGSTVEVTTPVKEKLTALINSAGIWNVTPTINISEGLAQNITATATNATGNSTVASASLSIDLTPPVLAINAMAKTNDTTPTISGTGEVGVAVVVTTAVGETLTTTVNGSGVWQVVPTIAFLTSVEQSVTARARDAAGNTNVASTKVTVDTSAPSLLVNAAPATNDTTPTISGTGDAGSVVELATPVGEKLTVTIGSNGSWSVTPTLAFSEGNAQKITATATNALGNSVAATALISIDLTPPALNIDNLAATSDLTPLISGTAEALATVQVITPVGETLTVVADTKGVWRVTPTKDFLAGANQTVTASAHDKAGNTSVAATKVSIDTTAPTLSINTLPVTNDSTPTISGQGDAGSTVAVTTPKETLTAVINSVGVWNVTPTLALGDGTAQPISAKATNAVGNTAVATGQVTIDTIAPALTINTMAATNDTTPLISGQGESGATVSLVTPVGETLTVVVSSSGAWQVTPTQAFSGGAGQNVGAVAMDLAGNSSVAATTVTIDTAAPALSINPNLLTNDSTPTISGKGDAGSTVAVTTPKEALTAVVNSAGVWSVTPTTALSDGAAQPISAKAVNALGNTSTATGTVSIDTIPPTVAINALALSNDATPTITGTAESGSTVTVTSPVGEKLTVVAGSSGAWSVVCLQAWPDGLSQNISALATDKAGNTGVATAKGAIDTAAPAAPTAVASDGNADGKPTVSGTAEAGSTVTILWPNGSSSTMVAGSNGAYSVESTVVIATGSVTVTSTDPAKNISANTVATLIAPHNAPSGTDKTITLNEDATYTFAAANFGFTDALDSPADTLAAVIITSLPAKGTLLLGTTAVTVGAEIPVASIGTLKYTPEATESGISYSQFNFQVKDSFSSNNLDPTPNTLTLNVNNVNDPFIFTSTLSNPVLVPAESTLVLVNKFLISDEDYNPTEKLELYFTLVINSGTVRGVYTWTIPAGYNLTDSSVGQSQRVQGTMDELNRFLADPASNFQLATTGSITGSVGTMIANAKSLITGGATSNNIFSIKITPVVLDLNNDGILSYDHNHIDVNADGISETMAWAGAMDGILVWDKLGDGRVLDNSQYAFAQYGGHTDLEGLAAKFDSDMNGVFDAGDDLFGQFAAWQDANQNGVSETGEVKSLADLGIVSINLISDGVEQNPAAGVKEFGRTTATLSDGRSMLVADAQFSGEAHVNWDELWVDQGIL